MIILKSPIKQRIYLDHLEQEIIFSKLAGYCKSYLVMVCFEPRYIVPFLHDIKALIRGKP